MTCEQCQKYLAMQPSDLPLATVHAVASHAAHCELCCSVNKARAEAEEKMVMEKYGPLVGSMLLAANEVAGTVIADRAIAHHEAESN